MDKRSFLLFVPIAFFFSILHCFGSSKLRNLSQQRRRKTKKKRSRGLIVGKKARPREEKKDSVKLVALSPSFLPSILRTCQNGNGLSIQDPHWTFFFLHSEIHPCSNCRLSRERKSCCCIFVAKEETTCPSASQILAPKRREKEERLYSCRGILWHSVAGDKSHGDKFIAKIV